MKSLLTALREGRLVELPETDKNKSLEYLAHLIEAIPDLQSVPELYEAVMARERSMNTALGHSIACPHVRVPGSGELLSAVGWSPQGIDYGAPDGKKVHLVVMYYIPDSEKNSYLKEISTLAAAVRKQGGIAEIAAAEDVASVREKLLDWVHAGLEANIPESRARMIRLEARQAESAAPAAVGGVELASVLFVQNQNGRPIVLAQQPELLNALENDGGLGARLEQRGQFDIAGYRLVFRSATKYEGARALYDYVALKFSAGAH